MFIQLKLLIIFMNSFVFIIIKKLNLSISFDLELFF